jgi:hypothetical protein
VVIVGDGVPDNGDDHAPPRLDRGPGWTGRLGSVSVDWWATAVAGVIIVLAVANVLPKIPW